MIGGDHTDSSHDRFSPVVHDVYARDRYADGSFPGVRAVAEASLGTLAAMRRAILVVVVVVLAASCSSSAHSAHSAHPVPTTAATITTITTPAHLAVVSIVAAPAQTIEGFGASGAWWPND